MKAAVVENTGIKPAFTVSEGGPYTRRIATFNKEKKTFEYSDKQEETSFILTMARGHSIRVRTMEEVERIAGRSGVKLVDLETGEDKGTVPLLVQKRGRGNN